MANNVLQQLAQRQQAQTQGGNMLQQLLNFKRTFQGDPKQVVMSMLQSGQINNAQLQQAMDQAKQISKLLR